MLPGATGSATAKKPDQGPEESGAGPGVAPTISPRCRRLYASGPVSPQPTCPP